MQDRFISGESEYRKPTRDARNPGVRGGWNKWKGELRSRKEVAGSGA